MFKQILPKCLLVPGLVYGSQQEIKPKKDLIEWNGEDHKSLFRRYLFAWVDINPRKEFGECLGGEWQTSM